MAKNAAAAHGAKAKVAKAKKNGHNKPKKGKMFKALKKHENRPVIVAVDKAAGAPAAAKSAKQQVNAKRRSALSSEFRNFDERMAGQKSKKQQQKAVAALKNPVIAPPTFVVAAPTFQLNAASQPSAPSQPDVRGFEGFLTAMQAPKDAPAQPVDHAARRAKAPQPQYDGQNVFAVLNDDMDEQQQTPQAPAFIQPATFSFGGAAATSKFQFQPQVPQVAAIDPDL